MGRFERWCDPDGYGNGTWGRRVAGGMFHVIEVTDMDDACGRDNEGNPKYVVELTVVDIDAITDKRYQEAKRSYGVDDMDDSDPRTRAEVLHGARAKGMLHSVSTDNRGEGFAECRKESYRLSREPGAMEEALNTRVNKIGSTALEYMQGDTMSAIARGVTTGDPSARLMAKLHGVPESALPPIDPAKALAAGKELRAVTGGAGGTIRLRDPELTEMSKGDHPLLFVMAFLAGYGSRPMDGPREELAESYFTGYKLGVSVRLGETPKPDWIDFG